MNEKYRTLVIISLLLFSGVLRSQNIDPVYRWEEVTCIDFYEVESTGDDDCNTKRLREAITHLSPKSICYWNDTFELLKEITPPMHDILSEKRCIVIEVKFAQETVPFQVFLEQGIVFDMREKYYQYFEVKKKKLFKEIIEKCIK